MATLPFARERSDERDEGGEKPSCWNEASERNARAAARRKTADFTVLCVSAHRAGSQLLNPTSRWFRLG